MAIVGQVQHELFRSRALECVNKHTNIVHTWRPYNYFDYVSMENFAAAKSTTCIMHVWLITVNGICSKRKYLQTHTGKFYSFKITINSIHLCNSQCDFINELACDVRINSNYALQFKQLAHHHHDLWFVLHAWMNLLRFDASSLHFTKLRTLLSHHVIIPLLWCDFRDLLSIGTVFSLDFVAISHEERETTAFIVRLREIQMNFKCLIQFLLSVFLSIFLYLFLSLLLHSIFCNHWMKRLCKRSRLCLNANAFELIRSHVSACVSLWIFPSFFWKF